MIKDFDFILILIFIFQERLLEFVYVESGVTENTLL